MSLILEKGSKLEQEMAYAAVQGLEESIAELVANKAETVQIKLLNSEKLVTIPLKALNLLKFVMDNMAVGNTVSVMNSTEEISTQEAADILNVSRPYVVKLLENGTIPYKKVGTHRRVLLEDVVAYGEEMREIREEQLAFLSEEGQLMNMALLAAQAQELKLGYE